MRKDSIVIVTKNLPDQDDFSRFLNIIGFVGELHEGDIYTAISLAKDWKIVPSFLVLDISGVDQIEDALEELSKSAPEGETSVILLGSENDVSLYRRLKYLGISDYLVSPLVLEDLQNVISQILKDRQNKGSEYSPEKIIGFIGGRGGVGTSSLAASTAHYLSQRCLKKTLLVDLDLQHGAQSTFFNLEQDVSMAYSEMLENPSRIDSLVLDRTIVKIRNLLNLNLLSTTSLADVSNLSIDPIRILFQQALQGMNYIVFDQPFRSPVSFEVSFTSGNLFFVTTPTILGLRDAVKFSSLLDSKNFIGNLTIILNRYGENKSSIVPIEEFRKRTDKTVIDLPYDGKMYGLELSEDKPLYEFESPLASSMTKLFRLLPEHVEKDTASKSLFSFLTKK